MKTSSEYSAGSGKKRRWPVITLIALCVLVVIGIGAAAFHLSDLAAGLKICKLLSSFASREEFILELTLDGEIGDQPLDVSARIDRQISGESAITCVEIGAIKLYFAGDAVFLDSGKGFRIGDTEAFNFTLPENPMALVRLLNISSGGKGAYTITVEGNDAKELLALLAPDYASRFGNNLSVRMEITAPEQQISEICVYASGSLDDGDQTSFRLSADLKPSSDSNKHCRIPQAVKDSMADGLDENALVLTRDLYTLAAAWSSLNSAEELDMAVNLQADCGPLAIHDSLRCCRRTPDGLRINAVQKIGYTLYFSDNAVCGENGNAISSPESSMVASIRLPEIIYELCLSGTFTVSDFGVARLFSLTLDQEGMKSVAAVIAPATANMDIQFSEGIVRLEITGDRISSIQIACSGRIRILVAEVDVSFGADLIFSESWDETFSIPQNVYEALKEKAGN